MKGFAFLIFCAFWVSCSRDAMDDTGGDNTTNLNFENVKLFDENGLTLGCFPECDDDWTHIDLDTFSQFSWYNNFSGLSVATDSITLFAVYPNPFKDKIAFTIHSPNKYALILKILDEDRNVYLSFAQHMSTGTYNLIFNTNNLDQGLKDDKMYRIYYRILNANKIIIYEGYGDIFRCASANTFMDCYPK